ncbi:MAG: arginase family protein [Deltaproteobacteria bacterium]|nr:arginase family protein [Deltaproteobacteria bacterium]
MAYPEWPEIRDETWDNSIFRTSDVPMIEADMPSFMGRPHATSAEALKGADVVIIGAPYAAGTAEYAGVSILDWLAAPKRIRQQSIRYISGYVQDFDLDVFEHLNLVDYGDADIPQESLDNPTAENVLKAQAAVEAKVNDVLEVGAIPIVIGQNSPCGSYAIAKPVSEATAGNVGMVSLDTHWDIQPLDDLTMDPRIAGSASWKYKTYELLDNFLQRNLVEIGERGMLEEKELVRDFLNKGTHFYPMWKVRGGLGIDGLCRELCHAYEGTDAVYAHFDMDVIGGAGPTPGDILGDLAEPIGMTDYEVLRISHELGKRGLTALSFICIPPGSPVIYRLIVYIIMYLMVGLAESRIGK